MSRYRWGNGKWFDCLPNSKIKYDSGSDTEGNENKTVQSTEQSKITSHQRESLRTTTHSEQSKSRSQESGPDHDHPPIRKKQIF